MNVYKLLLHIVFSVVFLNVKAQVNLKLVDSLDFKSQKFDAFVGVDIHENLFFKKGNVLIKTKDTEQWEYANFELGNITSVSLLNPLQILLFYKETNNIILLDHFLSETRKIDLNNLPNPKVAEWVENAKNQEVWLYNNLNNQLELFNYQSLNSISTSIPLSKTPTSLAANFNTVFVLFKDTIKTFNNYGTVLKDKKIDSIQKIQLQNNNLIGITKNKLILLDKDLNTAFNIKKPKNTIKDFFVSHEKLYIYKESKLYKYIIELPLK